MNKKTIIGVIVVVVVGIVWWMYASKPATAPTTQTETVPAAENSFTTELDSLNEADVTAEFQAIDTDLNQL